MTQLKKVSALRLISLISFLIFSFNHWTMFIDDFTPRKFQVNFAVIEDAILKHSDFNVIEAAWKQVMFPVEPCHEKTGLWDYHPSPIQSGMYIHRRLEAGNFGFKKKRGFTLCVAKTQVLISCAVHSYCTADLRLCFR